MIKLDFPPTAVNVLPLEQPPAQYLDPMRLDLAARWAQTSAFSGQLPNTRRTYETALLYWGAWHALRYGAPMSAPVSAAVVTQFVRDHIQHNPLQPYASPSAFVPSSRLSQHALPLAIDSVLVRHGYKSRTGPWSFATVETRLAALSRAHDLYIANQPQRLAPQINPLRDPSVRQLLSSVRRNAARQPPDPGQMLTVAATEAVMRALLLTCGDDLMGTRDRALLLFGFVGGRRRSEIVSASLENVRRNADAFVYELRGQQSTHLKPIQGEAAAALEAWLQQLFRAKITHGPIFRRIVSGRIGEPLQAAAVRDIIRRRAQMSDQPLGKLSAHSLRSGFITEAGRQNIGISEAMTLTGHRSVQAFIDHYRGGELLRSAVRSE
jgi:integrase